MVENTNQENHYVFVKKSDLSTSLLVFQIVTLSADELSNYVGTRRVFGFRFFTKIFQKMTGERNIRILINGNQSLTGDHGFISQTKDHSRPEYICQAITLLSKKAQFDAILLKDISSPTDFKAPKECVEFQADPNMILQCHWSYMPDYIASLRTKYRQRYKSTLKKSSHIQIRKLTAKEVQARELEINQLFNNIIRKDKFNLGQVSPNYFSELNRLKEASIHGYFLNDQLVGFRSSIRASKGLIAHFVGYLENINDSCKIYLRMLYDFVEEALEGACQQIYFGRTALEIKSTIGAKPHDLQLFLFIKSWFFRKLTYWFFRRLKTTEFVPRSPYKNNSS